MALCSIIILTYNALTYTKICIQSILQYTRPAYELIFVDNGSSDGTLNYLNNLTCKVNLANHPTGNFFVNNGNKGVCYPTRTLQPKKSHQTPPKYKIIKNSQNLGFSKGCNQGAAIARGDTLLFLNNDTIVTANWLEQLLFCLNSNPLIGAVCPASNFNPYAMVNLPDHSFSGTQRFAAHFNKTNPAKWRDNDTASGFCLLVKKAVFNQVGGFDERFTIGCYEDTDLTLRIHQAGYRVIIAGDTFIYHFGNRTFTANNLDLNQFMKLNLEKYQAKHFS